jgi:hypothetical protein
MPLDPFEDFINPGYLTQSQYRLLVAPLRKCIYFTRNLMGSDLLRRSKLPLPRREEEFVLPSLITGILRLQLYKFTPYGLEVVHLRASRIFVNPM